MLVDLGKFDAQGHRRGVARRPGDPRHQAGGRDEHATSNIEPASDPTAPDAARRLTVYVSSDFGSGYIEMAGDGTVKQINYPPQLSGPARPPESGPPM